MPIKGLSDRGLAFPQIGSIRKGAAKDPSKNQPGSDLKYFRMDFDECEKGAIEKFKALYPDGKPTDINIILPFDDIEKVWNPWREAYTAGALIHRCDGEFVNYAINPSTGERVVMNWHDAKGEMVKCTIQNHANKQQRCKPIGRLMVIVPQLERLAYLVVHTTSIHDIGNISDQLSAIREMNGGHIAGIPLILRRRPVEISTPSGADGKRARREKWLISIEADPEWVSAKIGAMKSAALPSAERLQIAAPVSGPEWSDIDDEQEEEEIIDAEAVEPSAKIDAIINKAIADNTKNGKVYHDAVTEQANAELVSAGLKTPKPAPNGNGKVKYERPYPARILYSGIQKQIDNKQGQECNDKQRGLVAGMIEACFAGDIDSDKNRHTITRYLIGVDSLRDATGPQVLALLDWLKPTKDSGGAYQPDSNAVAEAANVLHEAMIEAGQTEMEMQ